MVKAINFVVRGLRYYMVATKWNNTVCEEIDREIRKIMKKHEKYEN